MTPTIKPCVLYRFPKEGPTLDFGWWDGKNWWQCDPHTKWQWQKQWWGSDRVAIWNFALSSKLEFLLTTGAYFEEPK